MNPSTKAKNPRLGGWSTLNPNAWHKAVYSEPYDLLAALYQDEIDIIRQYITPNTVLIDYGCGSGELLNEFQDSISHGIGIDYNNDFLKLAILLYPRLKNKNIFLLCKNIFSFAITDNKIVYEKIRTSKIISVLAMNTLGIFPPAEQIQLIKIMLKTTLPAGTVILGCWNKKFFKQGIEQFYKKNPDLCGTIIKENYNLKKGFLFVPETGYTSQWWSKTSLLTLMKPYKNDYNIQLIEKGLGIFLIIQKS